MRTRAGTGLVGLLTALLSAVLVGSVSPEPALAQTEPVTTVAKAPFVVSSAGRADIAACVGESVNFTDGQFNVVRHITQSEDGRTLFIFRRNVMHGVGIGAATGTTYHATGHLESFAVTPSSEATILTFQVVLNVVAEGGDAHFTAHFLEHVTVTPEGELTAVIEFGGIRCSA